MKRGITATESLNWRGRIADYLSLERNVTLASAAVFLLGLGEELWKKFLPKYLEALGASTPVIGLFGTAEDKVSVARFGVLVAIQFITTLVVYVPAAKAADRFGRRPFIIATFCAFALFPLAIVAAHDFTALVFAFIVGGLREIGEPARKAMIVDFAEPALRARSVGLYYLIRCLTVTPAAAIGGLLWKISPATPFITAGTIGLVGVIVFAITVEERYA